MSATTLEMLRDVLTVMKLADEVPMTQQQHDAVIDFGKKYLDALLPGGKR